MKWSARDGLEFAGLACIVAAVAVAFGLAPALAAAGVGLVYLSHAYDFAGIRWPWKKDKVTHEP